MRKREEKKINTTSTKKYIYISIFTCLYQVLIMDFRERDGVRFEGVFFLVGWLIDWLVEEIFWRWWWEVFGFPLCF